jgi:hypothetical protein
MAKFSAALASGFLLALSAQAIAADVGGSGSLSTPSYNPGTTSNPVTTNRGTTPLDQDENSRPSAPQQNGGARQDQSAQVPSVPNNTEADHRSTESQPDQSDGSGIGKRNNDAGNNKPPSSGGMR